MSSLVAVFAGAGTTVFAAVCIWVGRHAVKFFTQLQQVIEDYRPVPPRVEHREGREITVDPGRPGMPGQIAELRSDLADLVASVNEATRLMELVAHVPEQLRDDRRSLHQRLDELTGQLDTARRLAADAAAAGSRADQRSVELRDLVTERIEALRAENETLRVSLNEVLNQPPTKKA